MNKPLIIWGGVDIHPKYYNEKPHPKTQHPDMVRDIKEFHATRSAIKMKQPIIGICRGAQLLCIEMGGKLHQHTRPHDQDHSILTNEGQTIAKQPGCHHQVMIPHGNHIVLAWNPNPVKIYPQDSEHYEEFNTPEVIWYPDINGLAIQSHPEWTHKGDPFNTYINKLLQKFNFDYQF